MSVPMPDLNNGAVGATRSVAAPISPKAAAPVSPIGGVSTGPVKSTTNPLAPKPNNGVVKANPFSNASYSLAHALRNPSVSQSSAVSALPSDLEEDEV
jgi:hypothetical protein